ncbi:MAG: ABC transporter ATP-binding protein [Candidatus Neomarinimicrobiota bacterium]
MPAAIEISNYSFSYTADQPVLDKFSLTLPAGEKMALLGRNGAGKSTLLRSIVGLLKGSGSIRVNGMEVERRTLKQIRRQVGFLFQDPQVQLFCPTVIEDVTFGPLNIHGQFEQARTTAKKALEQVGYDGGYYRPCHNLSLGEMRKVALAGVLACRPQILLLDEPDSYLDREGRRQLVKVIRGLRNETVLLVTHDRRFARQVCQGMVLL